VARRRQEAIQQGTEAARLALGGQTGQGTRDSKVAAVPPMTLAEAIPVSSGEVVGCRMQHRPWCRPPSRTSCTPSSTPQSLSKAPRWQVSRRPVPRSGLRNWLGIRLCLLPSPRWAPTSFTSGQTPRPGRSDPDLDGHRWFSLLCPWQHGEADVVLFSDYGSGKRIIPSLCERYLSKWCSVVVFSS
jgi:hypothetical protein